MAQTLQEIIAATHSFLKSGKIPPHLLRDSRGIDQAVSKISNVAVGRTKVSGDEVGIELSTVSLPDPLQIVGVGPELRFERKPILDRVGMDIAAKIVQIRVIIIALRTRNNRLRCDSEAKPCAAQPATVQSRQQVVTKV